MDKPKNNSIQKRDIKKPQILDRQFGQVCVY